MQVETAHGDAGFPLQVYRNDADAVRHGGERFIYTHFHDHLEFLLILAGEAEVEIDVRRYAASAGDVFAVNSGRIHSAVSVPGRACRTLSVVFDLRLLFGPPGDAATDNGLAPLLSGGMSLAERLPAAVPEARLLRRLLLQVAELCRSGGDWRELQIKAVLLRALHALLTGGHFVRAAAAAPSHAGQIERIKTVLDYMNAHLAERLTVRELAGLLHVSEAHFHDFFRAMTGQSPIDYLAGLRLERACGMLLMQRLTVQDTALRLGFGSVSHFIRRFKRRYGVTPAAYVRSRRRAAGNGADSDRPSS